jgi:hypothetical protein
VVFSIRPRISRAVAIGKVRRELMDARTLVRNHDRIKTGYAKYVLLFGAGKRLSQTGEFGRGEEALSLVLATTFDMPARVGMIGRCPNARQD